MALKPGVAELPDHSQHSKRAMAADVVAVLDALGVEQFFLCGHDRGGRVAHRLALDFAQRVRGLCVIDIAPTLDMYARTDMEFARTYYLVHPDQAAPPCRNHDWRRTQAYLHHKLGGWGLPGGGQRLHRPRPPPTRPQRLPRHPQLLRRHLTRRWASSSPRRVVWRLRKLFARRRVGSQPPSVVVQVGLGCAANHGFEHQRRSVDQW